VRRFETSKMLQQPTRRALAIATVWGTILGLAGAVGSRLAADHFLALPEGAELISTDGAVTAAPTEEPATDSRRVTSRSGRKLKRAWVNPIVTRNIFDSSKVGSTMSAEDDGSAGNKTALPLILLATIVAEPVEYSSALIMEEKGTDGSQGYGIGDSIIGEAVIHRIEARRVVLKRTDGALEYLDMEGSSVTTDRSTSKKKGGKWGGIEKTGENKFVVDEETFNKALENPEKLMNSMRAVPHTGPDGKPDGFRLSGIRRSSLFNKLGVRNGDVVHTVNGNELTSMQSAMEAYNGLQSERSFSFEITRRNKRQTFDYEVR